MSAESLGDRIEWKLLKSERTDNLERRGAKLILLGARLKAPYLVGTSVSTQEVFFEGALASALQDLMTLARAKTRVGGFALPIARLRASLLAKFPDIVGLDRDLGVVREGAPRVPALSSYPNAAEEEGITEKAIIEVIRRWGRDVLDPWAERYASTEAAQRLLESAQAKYITVVPADRPLMRPGSPPRADFSLIARQVAGHLIGEELFEDLGPCELVLDAVGRDPARSNSVELMTAPRRLAGQDDVFSMVARLSVVTVPYEKAIYLRVAATKRVWSQQVPGPKRNAPFRVRGYVMSPGRPFYTVSVERNRERGWHFGEDYAEWQLLASKALPADIEGAVAATTPGSSGWWVGLPQLTTLFSSVSPRTVYEGDESDLIEAVVSRLGELVERDIPFRRVALPRGRGVSSVPMLKLADLEWPDVGVAGRALEESEGDEATSEDEAGEGDEAPGRPELPEHREQNVQALRAIYKAQRPILWAFCDPDRERDLIRRSVEQLFGDAVEVRTEPLPKDTHGLRADLPGAKLGERDRFDLRVQAWGKAAQLVKDGPSLRHVLICAPDRERGRSEDSVNYYAGLHAMCRVGDANVHHVLPIGAGAIADAEQNFLYRLQSALMDVFFAHSGIVFGTEEFMRSLFSTRSPRFVYGIQALRSQARAFSGEMPVSLLAFTRLRVADGITEVRFVYRDTGTKQTEWAPLNQGLRWLGSQRTLENDESWLRESAVQKIRDFLGEAASEDPRGFVLVDWHTLTSLWKGLSDEDLTNFGAPQIEGKNIAAVCPQLTVIRLRRGDSTLALRARRTDTFARTTPLSGGLDATGEFSTQTYTTTVKAIVALQSQSDTKKPLTVHGHYIQSMGYRKTVQILRGQSCYRSRPRMRRRRPSFYELDVIEQSQQDAAIPAPLEVTVMAAPTGLDPDLVAIAVMGLRLGYAHYPEWTSLPAPLFFKRKIEDYVVRYRSPTARDDDEDEPESDAAPASEGVADETPADGAAAQPAPPPRAASPPAEGTPSPSPLLDRYIQSQGGLSDEELVALVKALAQEDFSLIEHPARYADVMREAYSVRVALPGFVTPEALQLGRAQSDRESRRLFMRIQRRRGWVRQVGFHLHRSSLESWIVSRLEIPQGARSVDNTPLFPPGSLLWPLSEGWQRYLQSLESTQAGEDTELDSNSVEYDRLMAWAVKERDDALVAWLIFGSAQFPSRKRVLPKVIPPLTAPIGPLTREALDYFVDSYCASKAILTGEARKQSGGMIFATRRRAAPEGATEMSPQTPRPQTQAQPSASASAYEEIGTEENNAPAISFPAAATVSPKAPLALNDQFATLVPGADDFEAGISSMQAQLEKLQAAHRAALEQREAGARQAVASAAMVAEAARWTDMRGDGEALLARAKYLLPDLQTAAVTVASEASSSLEQAKEDLQSVDSLVTRAKSAQDEYETVVARAIPPKGATPRESARHRSQWQKAVDQSIQTLDAALNHLLEKLRESSLFRVEVHMERSGAEAAMASPPAAEIETNVAENTPTAVAATETVMVREVTSAPAAPMAAESLVSADAISTVAPTRETIESDDTEESDDAEDTGTAIESTRPERVETLLHLMKARAYAAMEVYLRALQLDLNPETIGDHVLVGTAITHALRSLRSGPGLDASYLDELSRRLENQDLNLPDCELFSADLGILAAGLAEIIFARPQNNTRWTFIETLRSRFTAQGPLHALMERLGGLEGTLITVDTLQAAHIGAQRAAKQNLQRLRDRAKHWYADPVLYQKWTATDYRKLHDALFRSEDYAIGKCLAMIGRGEDAKLAATYVDARKKLEKPLVTIEDLGKRIGRRHAFDGVARGHISNNIAKTAAFIEEYQEAVRHAGDPSGGVAEHVRKLLDALYRDLVAASEYVETLPCTSSLDGLYRQNLILVLREIRRLFDCGEPPAALDESAQMLLLCLPLGLDLRPSLEPLIDQVGNVIPPAVNPVTAIEEIESLARRLTHAGAHIGEPTWLKTELERVRIEHLAHSRLLPARVIDQRLGYTGGRANEQQHARRVLTPKLQSERQRVTHAMALGALSQSEASRMQRLVEELLQAAKSLGDPQSAPLATPDFPHAYVALRHWVTVPLDEQLRRSRDEFFDELAAYLQGNEATPQLQADIDRIRALAIEESASSMRAARDMFSLLKEGALPRVSSAAESIAVSYTQFVKELRADLQGNQTMLEELVRALRAPPMPNEPPWLERVPAAARTDAAGFILTWQKLCAAKSSRDVEPLLTDLFKGLRPGDAGVVLAQGTPHAQRTSFSVTGWPLLAFDRSVSGIFVPPALGSSARGLQAVVFRQVPNESAIEQALNECGEGTQLLVLGHGHWSLSTRSRLSRHQSALLVDDDLIAYATLHPDARLQKIMQIALLTFHGNPYDDYGGPVPPEMFFGRRLELQRLRQVKTGAVLYGGRRLGKSSLLNQLQRDALNRKGNAVVYLTLDRADHGLGEDPTELAWLAIYRKLLQAGVLLEPQREPHGGTAIRDWIADEILKGRCKMQSIYLLIDEADETMGQDLQQGGKFIGGLQKLCEDVRAKCAMRFVIAGLHNLTRMASDENSPFGKFESIALKPFWSIEDIQRGIELIRVPLEALGFQFAPGKEDMPLRIMAVCNFYPAFIQLYCKRLIEHLYNGRDSGEPPTEITEKDLEKVELDKDFLADIRYKFKLNLDLDKRYAVIALVLAEQYYSEGAKALTAADVRDLCALFAPQHFATTGLGAYESLLDEMETLTILERMGSKYALRTPNIAMMLGDRESVKSQLENLSIQVPVQARSRGEIRNKLTSKQHPREQPFFPLPSAWVRNTFNASIVSSPASKSEADRDLLVLVGNELSGLSEIAHLKGDWEIGESAMFEVRSYSTPLIARNALVRTVRNPPSRSGLRRRLHSVANAAWQARDLAEYAQLAATLASGVSISDRTDSPSITRLALLATPERAYEIAARSMGRGPEEAPWRVVAVPPWNDDALYFYLKDHEKSELVSSDEAHRALLTASCGFGSELQRLCGEVHDVEGALRAPEQARKRLASNLETFYRRIGMPTAIDRKELNSAEMLLVHLDGVARDSEHVEKDRIDCDVSKQLFLFLQWMGLLQEASDGKWSVPALYRQLLS